MKGKKIVTLTTDWGMKDHYVASVKGKLMSLVNDEIDIVDITHQIQPLRVFDAAFVLKNCMDFFPEGTIHVIGVSSEASPKTPHVLIQNNGSFFIGADNGIFPLLFEKPEKIWEIEVFQDSDYFTFPTRDVFVKVAASIINGDDPSKVGPVRTTLNSDLGYFNPADTPYSITGVVVYIDNYGNLITNILEKDFKNLVKNKPFIISFNGYEITKISASYQDVTRAELAALFNTSGLLEIAQIGGRASDVLGMRFNDIVRVIIDE